LIFRGFPVTLNQRVQGRMKARSSCGSGRRLRFTGRCDSLVQQALQPRRCHLKTLSGLTMRSGRRQPPNHRLANIQKRRSALLSRGRGYRRCSTSNCCRKQRFSAINGVFGLNIAAMAHSRSRNTRPSGRSSASRSDSPAICQRQRGRWLFCAPQPPSRGEP